MNLKGKVNVTALLLASIAYLFAMGSAFGDEKIKYRPISTQFIAALGDPEATSGTGAETWGYWHKDPGGTHRSTATVTAHPPMPTSPSSE